MPATKSRVCSTLLGLTLVTVASACAESTFAPTQRREIHVRVQVSSGPRAVANEIKALEEIQAKVGPQKMVTASIDGVATKVSVETLLRRAQAAATRALPARYGLTTDGLGVRFDGEIPAGVYGAYTLASSPVSADGTGLAVAHMEADATNPANSTLDQDLHVVTTRSGQTIIDFHARGSTSLMSSDTKKGLDTRSNVQMSECDAINASTAHHFYYWWANEDYWDATSDWDTPMSTCCGGGDMSDRVVTGLGVTAGASYNILAAPNAGRRDIDCGAGSGGGGGGGTGGGGAGGGTMVICLYLDYYDENGVYLYSVEQSCWTEQM